MGSISLSLEEKTRVANESDGLSSFQWKELMDVFEEEASSLRSLMGSAGFEALRQSTLELDFFPDMPDSELAFKQIRHCFRQQPDALKTAAHLHFGTHEDQWSLKTQELALESHPSNANLAYQAAWLWHERLHEPKKAEAAYQKAIALDNKPASAWNGLGNLLQDHLGRYDEAEQAYRQAIAIAIDSKYASPWNNLGSLLQRHLGRYDEAEQAYRQAIALEDDPRYGTNLARLLWSTGRTAEATAQYMQVSQAPQTPDFLRLQTHLVLNNQQLALDALNRLAQDAEHGVAHAAYRLREQVRECTDLGLGERLADWKQQSPLALYLPPMIQALYILAGAAAKLQDLPLEVQQMADAVVQATQPQRHQP